MSGWIGTRQYLPGYFLTRVLPTQSPKTIPAPIGVGRVPALAILDSFWHVFFHKILAPPDTSYPKPNVLCQFKLGRYPPVPARPCLNSSAWPTAPVIVPQRLGRYPTRPKTPNFERIHNPAHVHCLQPLKILLLLAKITCKVYSFRRTLSQELTLTKEQNSTNYQ